MAPSPCLAWHPWEPAHHAETTLQNQSWGHPGGRGGFPGLQPKSRPCGTSGWPWGWHWEGSGVCDLLPALMDRAPSDAPQSLPAAHPTSQPATGQDRPAGDSRVLWGPCSSTGGCVCWPGRVGALGLCPCGARPWVGLGCRGLPCTQQLHTGTPQPGEGDTLVPPDETLPASSVPDCARDTGPAPPNEAANEGGALMSGVAVLPLWQLHQALSPPSPSSAPSPRIPPSPLGGHTSEGWQSALGAI